MSKKKSIVIIAILAVLIIGGALLLFPLNNQDYFEIGNTNYDFYWITKSIKKGLDLEGGIYIVYRADLSEFDSNEEAAKAMDGTIANIEALLFSKGYTEAVVTKQGNDQIRVEIPSVKDSERLTKLLGNPATLEFKDSEGKVLLTGAKHLDNADVTYYNGYYAITLDFNDEGTTLFAEATQKNLNKEIGIYIDGNEVMSPTVNSVISNGQAIIEGRYSYQDANDMAVKIKAGTFAVDLTSGPAATISPTLGANALKYALIAGCIGLGIIIVLMLAIYRGFGVISAFALMIYTELLIYALALVPWVQLTLPGIAGIILSIGMAVDANVIIFERIKDERRISNKAIASSVKIGFKKALSAIIDGNVTTIIGAIIMIIFGATTIQSFAITLLIGILLSMFTSLFVTRLLINISLSFNDTNDKYYGLYFGKENEEEVAL